MDIKNDIMCFISYFHRNNKLLKGIKSTFITLIPKKDNHQSLSDFCPISLVGDLYKLSVKLLANRLCSVIDSVILDTQSTFVKGRHIF